MNDKMYTLNLLRKLAISRGGKCLSKVYINSTSRMLWMCARGHEWSAVRTSITRGSWCSRCKTTVGEEICRTILGQLFKCEFIKVRPAWLLSPSGFPLELDGFCKKNKIAFEYQGRQHTDQMSFSRELDKIKLYDQSKRERCKELGITLIEIQMFKSNTKEEAISCVADALRLAKIKAPKNIKNCRFNLNKILKMYGERHKIILGKIAKDRGGKILSEFAAVNDLVLLRCKKGHKWQTRVTHIKEGHWCPRCGHDERGQKRLLGIEEVRRITNKTGGVCLERKYLGARKRHALRCNCGHKIKVYPCKIRLGNWCTKCKKKVFK